MGKQNDMTARTSKKSGLLQGDISELKRTMREYYSDYKRAVSQDFDESYWIEIDEITMDDYSEYWYEK